jgi:hypothetical protein
MEIPFDPSTPPPSPKVSGVAPTSEGVLEISYSLDGSQWNFLGYVGPDNWREASSFVLPLTSWEQLGSLQISLKGRLPFGSSAPQIYLDGIRVEAESLEPSILSRIFSPETVPSPSSLDEPGVFDLEAKHSCIITPFSASIPHGGGGHLIANLTPSTSGRPFVAEFGELPQGVVGEVIKNPSSTTSLFLDMQTSLTAPTGSYSLMFVYREKQPDGRTIPNFCQYNLVIQ